ncbi:MAG: DUF6785 family protein [Planctomycetota bacterium]
MSDQDKNQSTRPSTDGAMRAFALNYGGVIGLAMAAIVIIITLISAGWSFIGAGTAFAFFALIFIMTGIGQAVITSMRSSADDDDADMERIRISPLPGPSENNPRIDEKSVATLLQTADSTKTEGIRWQGWTLGILAVIASSLILPYVEFYLCGTQVGIHHMPSHSLAIHFGLILGANGLLALAYNQAGLRRVIGLRRSDLLTVFAMTMTTAGISVAYVMAYLIPATLTPRHFKEMGFNEGVLPYFPDERSDNPYFRLTVEDVERPDQSEFVNLGGYRSVADTVFERNLLPLTLKTKRDDMVVARVKKMEDTERSKVRRDRRRIIETVSAVRDWELIIDRLLTRASLPDLTADEYIRKSWDIDAARTGTQPPKILYVNVAEWLTDLDGWLTKDHRALDMLGENASESDAFRALVHYWRLSAVSQSRSQDFAKTLPDDSFIKPYALQTFGALCGWMELFKDREFDLPLQATDAEGYAAANGRHAKALLDLRPDIVADRLPSGLAVNGLTDEQAVAIILDYWVSAHNQRINDLRPPSILPKLYIGAEARDIVRANEAALTQGLLLTPEDKIRRASAGDASEDKASISTDRISYIDDDTIHAMMNRALDKIKSGGDAGVTLSFASWFDYKGYNNATADYRAKPKPVEWAYSGVKIGEIIPARILDDGRIDNEPIIYASRENGEVSVHWFKLPWGAWARPMTTWGVFLFALWAMMVSTCALLRKQWVDRERLTFPLAQVPIEMAEGIENGGAGSFFNNKLAWFGMALPMAYHSWNIVKDYNDKWPQIPLVNQNVNSTYLTEPPWNRLGRVDFTIFPAVLGLTYLISLEVSFSIWFFWIIEKVVGMLLSGAGYGKDVAAFTGSDGGIGSTFTDQGVGAMAAMVLFGFFMARGHLKDAIRKAIQGRRCKDVDDADEAMSYRGAFAMLLGSFIVMTLWLSKAMGSWIPFVNNGGHNILVSMTFIFLFFILLVGLTRLVAEGGLFFIQVEAAPLQYMKSLGTPALIGPAGMTIMGVTHAALMFDLRAVPMPTIMNALKFAGDGGVNRRHITASILVALALTTIFGFIGFTGLKYRYGLQNLEVADRSWTLLTHPKDEYQGLRKTNENIDQYHQSLEKNDGDLSKVPDNLKKIAEFDGARATSLGIGAVLMIAFMLLRQRIFWWPHPIGYVTWMSPNAMAKIVSSVFIGWFIKWAITKYGGFKAYFKMRKFFIGIIVGEAVIAIFWIIIKMMQHAPNMGSDYRIHIN